MTRAALLNTYLERFPAVPDMTLAKKIYKEHPLYFKDLETARSAVRQKRGHAGQRHRKELKDKTYVKPITHDTNPFKLPKSYSVAPAVYDWPQEFDRIGVISDLHVPYHSIEALTAALEYLKNDFKANGILINGDLIDFHMLSRFEHNPEKRSVKQEFEAARKILRVIRRMFPKAHIVYLKGNHCVRWEKFLLAKAPEIFDEPDFMLEARLKTQELNIQILHDTTVVRMGGLRVMHGHTVTRSMIPAVNAARGLFLKIKHSGMIGHTHKISEHTETDIDGRLITTWSTGCLCELNPEYHPHGNSYSHGFATCTLLGGANFSAKNFRIFDGKIL